MNYLVSGIPIQPSPSSALLITSTPLATRNGHWSLAEQALAIQRELLGERHPDTAKSLSSLAGYINALGDPKRALELAEQALAIQCELLGERHPDTATVLHNMAGYLQSLGKMQQAYACAQRAFEINKQIFGPQHPSTLRTANLLSKINRPGFRIPSGKKSQGKRKKGKRRR